MHQLPKLREAGAERLPSRLSPGEGVGESALEDSPAVPACGFVSGHDFRRAAFVAPRPTRRSGAGAGPPLIFLLVAIFRKRGTTGLTGRFFTFHIQTLNSVHERLRLSLG